MLQLDRMKSKGFVGGGSSVVGVASDGRATTAKMKTRRRRRKMGLVGNESIGG